MIWVAIFYFGSYCQYVNTRIFTEEYLFQLSLKMNFLLMSLDNLVSYSSYKSQFGEKHSSEY